MSTNDHSHISKSDGKFSQKRGGFYNRKGRQKLENVQKAYVGMMVRFPHTSVKSQETEEMNWAITSVFQIRSFKTRLVLTEVNCVTVITIIMKKEINDKCGQQIINLLIQPNESYSVCININNASFSTDILLTCFFFIYHDSINKDSLFRNSNYKLFIWFPATPSLN